jgi:hypothetical protein
MVREVNTETTQENNFIFCPIPYNLVHLIRFRILFPLPQFFMPGKRTIQHSFNFVAVRNYYEAMC